MKAEDVTLMNMNKLSLTLFVVTLLLAGCGSRTISQEEASIKYEYRDRVLRDSIHWIDTVRIATAGDTVFVDRVRYRDRIRECHDTVRLKDTIKVVYEKRGISPRRRSSHPFWFYLLLGVLLLCLFVYLRYKKK